MSAASQRSPDRATVWRMVGAPTDQVGSVNEPRTHETHGLKWNEQWVYRVEGGQEIERVVLWHRYDFLGVFRVLHDGSFEPEPLPTK